tara:strand:- start:80 stop:415 length:336 start_codon:yes stop_codon:yes gene_type:complete
MIDIRKIDYLFKVEFDVNSIIKELTSDKHLYRAWDVTELYNCSGKGLLIGVNWSSKMYIVITKDESGTYKISYLDNKLSLFLTQDNITSNKIFDNINTLFKRVYINKRYKV